MLAAAAPLSSGRVAARQATPAATPYAPVIDPARFTAVIDNRYLPLVPGTVFTYAGTSGGEDQRNVVAVTGDTRTVMGVACVVVRDQVFAGDTLVEDTFDWYAQDADGNVWYFGEDSKAYEDGKVSTEGSWEAGIDGARPGLAMEASPAVGDRYRQEYLAGVAEDMAEVLRTGESVTVPWGDFTDVLVTKEWTPLEPDVVEHKSYAPGVGMVLSESVQGEEERFELVDVRTGSPAGPVASPAG
jgi:hypothetical protein